MKIKNLENLIQKTYSPVEQSNFETRTDYSIELKEKTELIIKNSKNKILENLKHIHDDFEINEDKLNELYEKFAKGIRKNIPEINLKKEINKIYQEEKQIEKYITAFLLADKKIEKFKNLNIEEKKYLNTTNREIKYDETGQNIEDNLRVKSFDKLEGTMKEALTHIGNIFNKAEFPWAIIGSISLTLEAETAKKPDDIDLVFADVDFPVIYDNFKNLENKGLVKNIHLSQMKGFDKKFNGCTVIKAEIRTGNGPDYKWIEVEAFAQNIDPSINENGLCNPGLEKLDLNTYDLKGVKINCINRSELKKLYTAIGAAELLKYDIDNSFLHGIKNKFPQRLNNLIAIIKRRELEVFEKKLNKGEVSESERPNIENISDAEITEMLHSFISHNKLKSLLPLAELSHSTGDPSDIIIEKQVEFNLKAEEEETDKNKVGFTESKINDSSIYADCTCRETVLDKLTQEESNDMNYIAKNYQEIRKSIEKFNKLIIFCKEEEKKCDEKKLLEIKEMKDDILAYIDETLENISGIHKKYYDYLNIINAKDKRDFIAFVSIKQILDNYISPIIRDSSVITDNFFNKNSELSTI